MNVRIQNGFLITGRGVLLLAVATLRMTAQAQDAHAKLEYAAVLSRHGVRAALVPQATLNQYSSQPWRQIDAPVGYLTAHGRWEMQVTGVYHGQYLEQQGLIGKSGCEDAARFYFRSDSIQRDVESARAIAYGMFPDCHVPIHSVPIGAADPMFLTATSPGLLDRDLAAAALEGRTGGDPVRILKAHSADVDLVQKVLTGDGPAPAKTLLTPIALAATADRYTRASGPIADISSITDALLLEYEEGFSQSETAWGRLNERNLPALLALHESFVDQTWDIPLVARARGSDLLAHMLRSMQQAASGHAVEGALGAPGDKGVFVLGHDSDFGNLATMLNLSWILESFPPKATPPGAAMMFELWRDAATARRTVRLSIVGQTITQIHDAGAPTIQTPPQKIAVFIPGCSAATEGFPCEWEAFRRVMENAIDSGQVRPEPASLR
jgi:4-phytase / acid phosphatase